MQVQSSRAINPAYQPYFGKATTGADNSSSDMSSDTQYDFTNMTNAQLLDAAHELGSEGKISPTDESQLVGIASGVDYVPISGFRPSVSDYLQDPAKTNFITYIENHLAWDQSTGMAKAASVDNSLLDDLKQFQTHIDISA